MCDEKIPCKSLCPCKIQALSDQVNSALVKVRSIRNKNISFDLLLEVISLRDDLERLYTQLETYRIRGEVNSNQNW